MTAVKKPTELSKPGSGAMFNGIASRYDRLNKIMSFGIDRSWRRKLVKALGPIAANDRLLDVATGTADVALDIMGTHPAAYVTGLDPSTEMVRFGVAKVEARGLTDRIDLVIGDGQSLPFEDQSFDGACISFGIRNVPDRLLCIREMTRVTHPGRQVVILELTEPRGGFLSPFARFYVRHILPRIGGLLSGSKEYRYLQESIADFPSPKKFEAIMREAGLSEVRSHRLTMGTAHLFVGTVGRA
jgi:demethylmenaquinone methyltransferase/2-methoxy-6-polyprenyl-1,4-benzoquinol methylase